MVFHLPTWVKLDWPFPYESKNTLCSSELDRRKGAVYRSSDSGGSWTKMSDTVSGGTGHSCPQELVASPHHFDRIYLMNVRALVSEDGGKTFYTMVSTINILTIIH